MKIGAENRTKLALACGLFIIGVILMVRMFSSGGQPASAASLIAKPAAQPARAVKARPTARARRTGDAAKTDARKSDSTPEVSLDPRLRLDLLKLSEQTEYQGAGRNIFRAEPEPVIPQPVATPVKTVVNTPPPGPPPPPPPPPINLKFFGFANSPDQPARVFLCQGDDVWVAKEGDIVNRRYKVLRIGPKSVEIEDVLSNNRQTIPLTQG